MTIQTVYCFDTKHPLRQIACHQAEIKVCKKYTWAITPKRRFLLGSSAFFQLSGATRRKLDALRTIVASKYIERNHRHIHRAAVYQINKITQEQKNMSLLFNKCPQCQYSAPPREVVGPSTKHFWPHAYECTRCGFRSVSTADKESAHKAWNNTAVTDTHEPPTIKHLPEDIDERKVFDDLVDRSYDGNALEAAAEAVRVITKSYHKDCTAHKRFAIIANVVQDAADKVGPDQRNFIGVRRSDDPYWHQKGFEQGAWFPLFFSYNSVDEKWDSRVEMNGATVMPPFATQNEAEKRAKAWADDYKIIYRNTEQTQRKFNNG